MRVVYRDGVEERVRKRERTKATRNVQVYMISVSEQSLFFI